MTYVIQVALVLLILHNHFVTLGTVENNVVAPPLTSILPHLSLFPCHLYKLACSVNPESDMVAR